MLATEWYPAAVAADEIHVWIARISTFARHERDFARSLDRAETLRAERFHFERDRTRFVIAHGLVRTILGRYVDAPPSRLSFEAGPYGKPTLRAPHCDPAVEFNLSHANDVVLLAVTTGRPVGVDVECVTDCAFEAIADSAFSVHERAQLASLPAHERRAGFFAAWTRKEAYVKALGCGIGDRLTTFDMSVAAYAAPRLIVDRRDADAGERWQVRDVDVCAAYVAAVVGAGAAWRLRPVFVEAA